MTELAIENPWGYGAADLRRETPGRTLGELLHAGMLIQAGPDSEPYLVERVTPAESHGVPCWRVTGWYAPDGLAERNEAQRWWLNEWIAVDYSPAPLGFIVRPIGVYTYDCPARDACFIPIGRGSLASRTGQLGLLL